MTSASARAIEILPLPFLVKTTPEPARPVAKKPAEKSEPSQVKPKEEPPPPNPFAPLPQRLKVEKPPRATSTPASASVRPKTPVQRKPVVVKAPTTPELVQVPVPKIRPPQTGEPVLPPEADLKAGILPVRLEPLERVVSPPPEKNKEQASGAPHAQNPLAAWAKEQNLRLAGVALGPVSVAIFATKHGYVAIPVGERFPGTDILLKSVTAERVLLVQGPYTLTLEYGGGE